MSAAVSQSRGSPLTYDLLVVGLVVCTCIGAALGQGPALALAPLGLVAVVFALRRAPLAPMALLFLAVVLGINNPQESPASGRWKSPLDAVGVVLFDNLNKSTGIDALRFSLIDVLILGLAAVAWARESQPAPRCVPLRDLCWIGALALIGIEGFGLVMGGDFRNSLWQIQQPLAAPLLALLFLRILDIRKHRVALGAVILGAACIKALLGVYVFEVVFRALGEKPQYTTIHSDSVVFTVALVMVAAFAATRRTRGALALAAVTVPLIAVAIVFNNRRLAWVEVGASALVFYALLPRQRLKQLITRTVLLSLPVFALYGVAGWNSSSSIFAPVQVVRSLGDSDRDRSTATRDIENYNLIQTLKTNPLLGTGYGHEYHEVSKADDISAFFAQYRYIPHNSLLGLWAFGGLLGFAVVWLPLAAGLFLAARSYQLATSSLDRTTAVALVAGQVAYTLQCWGDMGFQSWPGTFMLAACLAGSGQLAVKVGAWPSASPEVSS